jgi:hypothetical protein
MVEFHAKDIRDTDMLTVIAAMNARPWPGGSTTSPRWMMTWELDEAFSPFPPKVVLAKARALIKRGLIDGCGCGCRGDFVITTKGRELLAS